MGANRDERLELDQGVIELTIDELREFLEGDLVKVHADPEFKEQLRLKLWKMVRARAAARKIEPKA